MNTYAITRYGHTTTAFGKTAGQAKYNAYSDSESGYEFGGWLKTIESCRLQHKFRPSDLFGDIEYFNHMKQQRDIDFAYMGMRVEVDGKPGIIVGSNMSQNLDVCFDGEHWKSNCHPWWRVKYFDSKGNVIKEFGD
jgi:hypothetical protein